MSEEMLKVSFNAFSFSNIFKIVFTRSSSKIKLAMIFFENFRLIQLVKVSRWSIIFDFILTSKIMDGLTIINFKLFSRQDLNIYFSLKNLVFSKILNCFL